MSIPPHMTAGIYFMHIGYDNGMWSHGILTCNKAEFDCVR